jgi:hypothetical protein
MTAAGADASFACYVAWQMWDLVAGRRLLHRGVLTHGSKGRAWLTPGV